MLSYTFSHDVSSFWGTNYTYFCSQPSKGLAANPLSSRSNNVSKHLSSCFTLPPSHPAPISLGSKQIHNKHLLLIMTDSAQMPFYQISLPRSLNINVSSRSWSHNRKIFLRNIQADSSFDFYVQDLLPHLPSTAHVWADGRARTAREIRDCADGKERKSRREKEKERRERLGLRETVHFLPLQ